VLKFKMDTIPPIEIIDFFRIFNQLTLPVYL
jgi:hypothetical protein